MVMHAAVHLRHLLSWSRINAGRWSGVCRCLATRAGQTESDEKLLDVQMTHRGQSMKKGSGEAVKKVAAGVFEVERKLMETVSPVEADGKLAEERLVTWMKMNGMEDYGTCIGKSDVSGRGLFATRDILKGDVLLVVPMHMTLMVHPSDEEMNIHVPDDLPETVIRLSIKLVKLSKSQSPFDGYLHCLPTQLPHPSSVFIHVCSDDPSRSEMQTIVGNYERTIKFLMDLKLSDITEMEMRRSLAIIQSRSFGNGMGQEMLVPYVDIMNHGDLHTNEFFPEHPHANVTYGWLKSGQHEGPENWKMIIKARQTILEGEELFVSYGDHSNEFFLLFYGFVPLFNPRNEYLLFANLDEILSWFFQKFPEKRGTITDEELEKLKETIRIEDAMLEVVKLNLCADGTVSPIMKQFFKFLCNGSSEKAITLIAEACLDQLNIQNFLRDYKLLRDAAIPDAAAFYE